MDSPSINILSLCAGVGGLDLGVDLATGGNARAVCYVEREAFAASILAARMEDQALAPAPIWSDLRTFDGRPWRGIVDCVIGGYPCQPFSLAGRRLGQDDPRHLWPSIARIIGEIEPGIVFFENVAGHLSLGFDAVRADLTARGYRVAAGLFTAAEVGAPHKRERLFILGVADDDGFVPEHTVGVCGEQDWAASNGAKTTCGRSGYVADDPSGGRGELRPASGGDVRAEQDGGELDHAQHRRSAHEEQGAESGGGSGSVDHPRRERPQGIGTGGPATGPVGRGDGALADTTGGRGRIGEPRPRQDRGAVDRGTGADLGIFPPGPGDRAAWERILAVRPDLAPATQPGVRGVADGATPRLDRLRALGNGVVPLCAAYAFVSLWACLQDDHLTRRRIGASPAAPAAHQQEPA